MRRTTRRTTHQPLRTAAFAAALVAVAAPVPAQPQRPPLEVVQIMAFDRPEAWAMKYFTSLSLLTGLGPPSAMRRGAVELALEGGLVPNLGEDKRRVGFVGDKVEDLNRTNLFGRARVTVGLGSDFALTLGVTPPLEVGGITPRLLSAALARPVYDSPRWRLGLRLHGQIGTIEGDITCPRDIAGLDDPRRNPDACLEPSVDEATQSYLGLEASLAPRVRGRRWEPYVSLLANHLDLEFQVNARVALFDDRTRLETDGLTWALAVGAVYRRNERWRLAGEIFYSPLDVVRDPARGAQTDELVNGRMLVTYAWR